jgi:hypothetical protein
MFDLTNLSLFVCCSYLWTTREALKKTKLYSLAWDSSDMVSKDGAQVQLHGCSAMMKVDQAWLPNFCMIFTYVCFC